MKHAAFWMPGLIFALTSSVQANPRARTQVAVKASVTAHPSRAPTGGEAEVEPPATSIPAAMTSAGAAAVERAAASTRGAGRIYSKAYTTWIWEKPTKASRKLGYVRVGTSVARRSGDPRKGVGCGEGFAPVAPRGWICLDRAASLAPSSRYLRAMQHGQPGTGGLPYAYALSNGAPMYRRLPTAAEATRAERFLGKPGTHKALSWGNRGHELLADAPAVQPRDAIPFFLKDGGSASSAEPLGLVRRTIPLGSMVAYTRAFEHDDRTWLLSADGTVVPADRVRPFRESTFEGAELGAGLELPVAWFRATARPKYVLREGTPEATGDAFVVRSHVALDAAADPVTAGKRVFLKTLGASPSGEPIYVDARDATVVRRRDLPFSITDADRWLVVSITEATLVAYEGTRPVFTTLVSPGVGGPPSPGKSPVKTSSTPMGIYRVTYKHVAATMSPEQGENRSFWIADVPYTQYFHAPFALHVAYWHENFGEGMSAGCINLSPRDGKRLFEWTGPRVPEGWNGAGAGGENGPGTFVVVVR